MFGPDLVVETIAVSETIKRLTKAKRGWAVLITVVVSGVVAVVDGAREGDLNPLKIAGTWINTAIAANGSYMVGEDLARKIGAGK